MHMKIIWKQSIKFWIHSNLLLHSFQKRCHNSVISVALLIKSHYGLKKKNKHLLTKNNALSTSLHGDIKKKEGLLFPLNEPTEKTENKMQPDIANSQV